MRLNQGGKIPFKFDQYWVRLKQAITLANFPPLVSGVDEPASNIKHYGGDFGVAHLFNLRWDIGYRWQLIVFSSKAQIVPYLIYEFIIQTFGGLKLKKIVKKCLWCFPTASFCSLSAIISRSISLASTSKSSSAKKTKHGSLLSAYASPL